MCEKSWRDYLYLSDEHLQQHCSVETFKVPGPGGQKKNVTNSAVRIKLRHRVKIEGTASESRSQHQNKLKALTRLRLIIALKLRSEVSNTDLADLQKNNYLLINPKNSIFPITTAILFDQLKLNAWDHQSLARDLNIGTNPLIRALKKDRTVWRALTEEKSKISLRHPRNS